MLPELVLLAGVFVLVVLFLVADVDAPLRAQLSADPPRHARAAVWLLVLIVPVILGVGVAMARLELQHTRLSWQLPGLRRALVTGTLMIALPVSAALAWLVGRSVPASSAFAAFSVALFSFTAAPNVFDVAIPRALRWLPAALLVVVAVRLSGFARIVEQWPLAIALPALALSGLLMTLQFSDRSARNRYVRWSMFAPRAKALYWAGRRESPRVWTRSLATERLVPWLWAAEYEGSVGRFTYPTLHLGMAALAVLGGHLVSMPVVSVSTAGMFLSFGQLRLGPTLLYPLSRSRRADLAETCTLIDATTSAAMMAVVLLAVRLVSLPPIPWFPDATSLISWAAAIGMTFAWAPIAQWTMIRWPDPESLRQFRCLAPLAVFALMAVVSALALAGQPPLVLAAATAGIGAIARLLFRIAVRRRYRQADLVQSL
jgi:hypothetical protein